MEIEAKNSGLMAVAIQSEAQTFRLAPYLGAGVSVAMLAVGCGQRILPVAASRLQSRKRQRCVFGKLRVGIRSGQLR